MVDKKQTEIILEHIDTFGHITNRDASRRYEIYRLSEIIRLLREKLSDGTTILTVDVRTDNTGKHYARYYRVHRDRLPEDVCLTAPRMNRERFIREMLLEHGEMNLFRPLTSPVEAT